MSPHPIEKRDWVQGGKKETSTRPRESAYTQTPLVSWFPQWGMWSGHDNCNWPTYKAQELFLVHPSLRRAWKWRKYLEGKCSLNVLFFLTQIHEKILFLIDLARQKWGHKNLFLLSFTSISFLQISMSLFKFWNGWISVAVGEYFVSGFHGIIIRPFFKEYLRNPFWNTAKDDSGDEMEPRKHLPPTLFLWFIWLLWNVKNQTIKRKLYLRSHQILSFCCEMRLKHLLENKTKLNNEHFSCVLMMGDVLRQRLISLLKICPLSWYLSILDS